MTVRAKRAARGFGLIEIVLVLAIIAYIIFKVLNYYYKKPVVNQEEQKIMAEQGINTTNYGSVKDSVSRQIQNIKNVQRERTEGEEQ